MHTARMRLLLLAAVCLFTVCAAYGAPIRFDSLKAGSTVYKDVTVLSVNETDVYFRHEDGMANAKLKRLEPKAQKILGYDAAAAEQREQIHIAGEQTYQSNVLATLSSVKAPAPVRTLSASVLSDPISERSLVGKPGPALRFDIWPELTEAPSDKHILLLFWTPWSLPARKAVAHVAALQKKFADQLVVLGLNPDPGAANDAEADGEPLVPTAPDTDGKIAAGAGATSVPFVLLMDPEKKVIYQGHPAVLTEVALATILTGAP